MALQIISETPEHKASDTLFRENPRNWRARYDAADTSGAVRSAAKASLRDKSDYFVILSNSYGRGAWVVSANIHDVQSRIVNSGRRAFRVSGRTVFRINLEA